MTPGSDVVREPVDRLAELDRTMTPGPWDVDYGPAEEFWFAAGYLEVGPFVAGSYETTDADGIAYLRTHLPEIVAALQQARDDVAAEGPVAGAETRLRRLAEALIAATPEGATDSGGALRYMKARNDFRAAVSPDVVLGLLDRLRADPGSVRAGSGTDE